MAIERFIVDFCSPQARVIIEVDGPIHDYQAEKDAIRQEYLEGLGFQVIRFTNLQVLNEIDAVMGVIAKAIATPS